MRYFLLLLVCWFYGMGISDLSNDAPHGIHFIRQTDGLAFAQHYWKYNVGFFEPGTLNLSTANGKAVCEFPIFYFLSAQLYSSCGYDADILRVLHGLTALISVFALWGITAFFTKDLLLRLLSVSTLFTVTVFNFYAFNFLPDMPAFAFSMLGYYWALKFIGRRTAFFMVGSAMSFALAGMLKATFFIHPAAFFIAIFFSRKENSLRSFFIWLVAIAIPVFLWWSFVLNYNKAVGDFYFTTSPKAIWDASQTQLIRVWEAISKHWRNSYFPKYSWYGLGGMLMLIFIFWRQINVFFRSWFLALLLGGMAYILLFWLQLEHHDYYFLNVLPWFLLTFLIFFHWLEGWRWKHWIKVGLLLLCVAFTTSSWVKAKDKMFFRLNEVTDMEMPMHRVLKLQKLYPEAFVGIEQERIWIVNEKTKNGVFVALHSQGITEPRAFDVAFASQTKNQGITRIILIQAEAEMARRLDSLGWRIIANDTVHQTMLLDHP